MQKASTLPYIPYEKVTTLTTFLGLIEEWRDFTAKLTMYMAITGGMLSGFRFEYEACESVKTAGSTAFPMTAMTRDHGDVGD